MRQITIDDVPVLKKVAKEARQSPYLRTIILALLLVLLTIWVFNGVEKTEALVEAESEQVVDIAPELPSEPVEVEMVEVETIPTPEIIEPQIEPQALTDGDRIYDYLVSYGSPVPEVAYTIDEVSKANGVDPYIITAIACQESSCFKNCYLNNCTGFGITDSGLVGKQGFSDVHEGMSHMIEKYNEVGYSKCGSDIGCVGYGGYNPRDSWVNNVSYFYEEVTK